MVHVNVQVRPLLLPDPPTMNPYAASHYVTQKHYAFEGFDSSVPPADDIALQLQVQNAKRQQELDKFLARECERAAAVLKEHRAIRKAEAADDCSAHARMAKAQAYADAVRMRNLGMAPNHLQPRASPRAISRDADELNQASAPRASTHVPQPLSDAVSAVSNQAICANTEPATVNVPATTAAAAFTGQGRIGGLPGAPQCGSMPATSAFPSVSLNEAQSFASFLGLQPATASNYSRTISSVSPAIPTPILASAAEAVGEVEDRPDSHASDDGLNGCVHVASSSRPTAALGSLHSTANRILEGVNQSAHGPEAVEDAGTAAAEVAALAHDVTPGVRRVSLSSIAHTQASSQDQVASVTAMPMSNAAHTPVAYLFGTQTASAEVAGMDGWQSRVEHDYTTVVSATMSGLHAGRDKEQNEAAHQTCQQGADPVVVARLRLLSHATNQAAAAFLLSTNTASQALRPGLVSPLDVSPAWQHMTDQDPGSPARSQRMICNVPLAATSTPSVDRPATGKRATCRERKRYKTFWLPVHASLGDPTGLQRIAIKVHTHYDANVLLSALD
eukprot:364899-Chlamydomonas_euryale.AAC.25